MTWRNQISTEAGLLKFGGNVDRRLTADPLRYGLTADRASQLNTSFLRFDDAMTQYGDPLFHSPPYREAKDIAKRALTNSLADIVEQVYANKALSGEILEELSLSPRDRRPTPVPAPTVQPQVAAFLTGDASLRIEVRDPSTPDRRAKPRGVRVIEVHTFEGPEPVGDVGQWPLFRLSGRATIDGFFPQMFRETTVWVSCCYVSSRNERGPMSRPVSVRLPGTGNKPVAATQADQPPMKIAA